VPDEHPLAPASVSRKLFVVAPDRDERASHLTMETLLTLWANGYKAPPSAEKLAPHKRRNGAIRSLAVRENFLEGLTQPVTADMTVEEMGSLLAHGSDFGGSDGLNLVQEALQALVDGRSRQGSAGALLMQPFHESLLWYDARKSGSSVRWMTRKVNMRGTGVTLARLLLDPPAHVGDEVRGLAVTAVAGIRSALQAPSPYGDLAERLSAAVPDEAEEGKVEPDEIDAWNSGDNAQLAPLAERVIRHAYAITTQTHVGSALKLLQLRNILALDLAHYALTRSWEATSTPPGQRFLLASYTPEERRHNRVRIFSETSYRSARQKVSRAIISQLASAMQEIAETHPKAADWSDYFEPRSKLDSVATALAHADREFDFGREAERAYELASGGGYGRPSDAFRVLIESVDLLVGTGQYRYLRIGPELLASMVGALAPALPVAADRFLALVFDEWNIVIGEAEAVGTDLGEQVEGAELRRNSRFLEELMVNAGLALALSDQTCIVGQRRAVVT
jgi:hypothetical protein